MKCISIISEVFQGDSSFRHEAFLLRLTKVSEEFQAIAFDELSQNDRFSVAVSLALIHHRLDLVKFGHVVEAPMCLVGGPFEAFFPVFEVRTHQFNDFFTYKVKNLFVML
jgi:hypothetical protein